MMPISPSFNLAARHFAVLPFHLNNRGNVDRTPSVDNQPAAFGRLEAMLGERTSNAERVLRRKGGMPALCVLGRCKALMLQAFPVLFRSGRNGGSVEVDLYTTPLSKPDGIPFRPLSWYGLEKWEGVRGRGAT